MSQTIWQRGSLRSGVARWFVILLGVAMVTLGCEDSPEDKLMDGRQALATRQADLAQERLEAAIEANPDLVEAKRLMANVYMLRHDFETAEQVLAQLWAEQGFDREGDLNADQRRTRQLMNKQYSDLYRQWAKSIDITEAPDELERVGQTGLQRNSRDSRLNAMMVEFYEERAERLIEQNDRVKAAEMLERIDDLHTFTDIRRASRERAHQVRREAFFESAQARFEEELQPDLMEGDSYDPETEIVRMAIEHPVDRRFDPDDDEAVEQARNMASQTLLPMLSQFTIALSDLDVEEVELSHLEVPEHDVVDENFRPSRYDMTVEFELSTLIDMAFEYAELERTRHDDQSGGTTANGADSLDDGEHPSPDSSD